MCSLTGHERQGWTCDPLFNHTRSHALNMGGTLCCLWHHWPNMVTFIFGQWHHPRDPDPLSIWDVILQDWSEIFLIQWKNESAQPTHFPLNAKLCPLFPELMLKPIRHLALPNYCASPLWTMTHLHLQAPSALLTGQGVSVILATTHGSPFHVELCTPHCHHDHTSHWPSKQAFAGTHVKQKERKIPSSAYQPACNKRNSPV